MGVSLNYGGGINASAHETWRLVFRKNGTAIRICIRPAHNRHTDEVEMKKTQYNPLVISNVYSLGKGEVACSNHASSTISCKNILNVFNVLWRFWLKLSSFIIAVLLLFWTVLTIYLCTIYDSPAQIQHNVERRLAYGYVTQAQ